MPPTYAKPYHRRPKFSLKRIRKGTQVVDVVGKHARGDFTTMSQRSNCPGLTVCLGSGLPLVVKPPLLVIVGAAGAVPGNVMHDAGEPGRPLLSAKLFCQRSLHPDAAWRNSQGETVFVQASATQDPSSFLSGSANNRGGRGLIIRRSRSWRGFAACPRRSPIRRRCSRPGAAEESPRESA